MSRPGAQDFVTRLSEKFELVIFTAAQENYANWALAIIDPLHKIVFRLYRQHLTCYGAGFVKDLSILGRDLDRVAIIDNEPGNFRCQPENGIKISTWTGQADDRELSRIQMAFLEIWHEGVGFKEFIKDLGF
jgi:CTD small phosphatase-like protein 2